LQLEWHKSDAMSQSNEDEKYKLTVTELKKFKGFENIENTEAEAIINSLYMLSLLLYNFYTVTNANE